MRGNRRWFRTRFAHAHRRPHGGARVAVRPVRLSP